MTESVTTQPWRLEKTVLPQHTDHAGVMWHGTYVAWLEEARVEALAAVGLSYASVAGQGYEMPVVRLQIHYRQSLCHGDLVVLESMALPRRGARWPWSARFCLPDGTCMAEAEVELVIVQLEGGGASVLRRPPLALREGLQALVLGPSGKPMRD